VPEAFALTAGKPLAFLLDHDGIFSVLPRGALGRVLTTGERSYLKTLRNEKMRSRFLAGRAVARILLSRLMDTPPPEQLFTGGATGTPVDQVYASGARLAFSISHSGVYTLYGFGREQRVGADIEAVRLVRHMPDLARYAFSFEEAEWLLNLPSTAAEEAFIRLWTRKEAVVKLYRGTVAHDMHRFAVPLVISPGVFEIYPRLRNDSPKLHLMDLEVEKGIFGALCWDGPRADVNVRRIDPDDVLQWLEHHRSVLRARA